MILNNTICRCAIRSMPRCRLAADHASVRQFEAGEGLIMSVAEMEYQEYDPSVGVMNLYSLMADVEHALGKHPD